MNIKGIKFTGLPSQNDQYVLTCTKGELAKRLYPKQNYDTALPQPWVNECQDKGFDVRGHAIWIYRPRDCMGSPAALTQEFFNWYKDTYHVFPICPKALENN